MTPDRTGREINATWDEAVPMTMPRRDGHFFARDRFEIDDFPAVTAIDDRFLAEALAFDRPLVRRDGALIRFRFDNGWCAYRVVEHDPWREKSLCVRLGSSP